MVLRNRYFLLYLACALLLGIPSLLVWFREPFLVTKNEFDFFLGLFGEFPDMDPRLAMLGKVIHFGLIVLMGWAYYRLITQLGEGGAPLKWRDLVIPSALVLAISFVYLPWHSPDSFFYFGTGWIESHYGMNPYRQVIVDAPGWQTDPTFRNVYPGWLYIITPYGPLFVKFIGAVTYLAGGDDRLATLLTKAAFAVCHLLNGWFVAGISRRLGFQDRLAVLLYLISPVPLLDYMGWVHNDILMITCVLAGLWAMLSRRYFLATLLLGVGAGFKYVPVLFCPYLFLYMTRGRPLKGQIPRIVGLGLVLTAVLVSPYLWYENGLANFLRLFRGQDQQLHNILYTLSLSALAPSADEAAQAATLQVIKLVLKVVFLIAGAGIAYRLWRRGPGMTADDVFSSIVVLFLVYFAVGSPEIHEWYAGWFLCFVFWVNNRAYFNVGMVLTTLLNAVAIFEVRCPPALIHIAWSVCFLAMWGGLYYLWKQQQANAWQRSPLAPPGDGGGDERPGRGEGTKGLLRRSDPLLEPVASPATP
jgi:hypothetical protein